MTDAKVGNITMADLNRVVEGITLKDTFRVRENEDMPQSEAKRIHLEVDFDGVELGGVFAKTLKPTKIQLQGRVRSKWAEYKNEQTVKVKFVAPTETYVDPTVRLIAEAKRDGIDTDDIDALTAYIVKRTLQAK
jgi:hypothetical protein